VVANAGVDIGNGIIERQAGKRRGELIDVRSILGRMRTPEHADVQLRQDDRAKANLVGRAGSQALADQHVLAAKK
jgi:hypothetical protein